MAVEWLGLARFAVSSVKSLYDYSFGQSPHMNFEASDYGVKLRIGNPRTETIIVETIDASPSILGFSLSHEIDDLARAIATHRQIPVEEAMAVVSPKADVVISVLTFDPFGTSSPGLIIRVRLHWRRATRGLFSKRRETKKISVSDIRDLQWAAERRRP
jgi:hypothetical protein